jgi:hypothetical protein
MTKTNTTEKKGEVLTSLLRNGWRSAMYDSFMVVSSAALQLNSCAKIRHYSKRQNDIGQLTTKLKI